MRYRGYFINLDRNPERRVAMEAQLANLSPPARYQRFPAVDGAPPGSGAHSLSEGEFGCLMSHYMVLQMHLAQGAHLHIVEDDILMARQMVIFLDHIIDTGLIDDYDIVFTETLFPMDLDVCREARQRYNRDIHRMPDGTASVVNFTFASYSAATSSYLVNKQSIPLICGVLEQALDRGASQPIDMLFRDAISDGTLRGTCLFPFVTSARPAGFASTIIRDDRIRPSRLALDLLRHSFFVECDLNEAMDLADRGLTRSEDVQERLHARIAGFISSDAYQPF